MAYLFLLVLCLFYSYNLLCLLIHGIHMPPVFASPYIPSVMPHVFTAWFVVALCSTLFTPYLVMCVICILANILSQLCPHGPLWPHDFYLVVTFRLALLCVPVLIGFSFLFGSIMDICRCVICHIHLCPHYVPTLTPMSIWFIPYNSSVVPPVCTACFVVVLCSTHFFTHYHVMCVICMLAHIISQHWPHGLFWHPEFCLIVAFRLAIHWVPALIGFTFLFGSVMHIYCCVSCIFAPLCPTIYPPCPYGSSPFYSSVLPPVHTACFVLVLYYTHFFGPPS